MYYVAQAVIYLFTFFICYPRPINIIVIWMPETSSSIMAKNKTENSTRARQFKEKKQFEKRELFLRNISSKEWKKMKQQLKKYCEISAINNSFCEKAEICIFKSKRILSCTPWSKKKCGATTHQDFFSLSTLDVMIIFSWFLASPLIVCQKHFGPLTFIAFLILFCRNTTMNMLMAFTMWVFWFLS